MKIALVLLVFQVAQADFHQAPKEAAIMKNPVAKNETSRKRGAKLFSTNCAVCHGQDARGMGNIPSLVKGPAQRATEGELFWFITRGSPANGMPPAKLSEEERWTVASFIKSLPSAPIPVGPEGQRESGTVDGPPPPPPFTDYRFENPGTVHKILPEDLPPPAPETSVGNGPRVVPRPAGAWPQVPKDFKVQLYASGLENPRLLRTAPNGDIFLAESNGGKILSFRGMTPEGKYRESQTFLSGLDRPYGIAFYPQGKNPKWIYIGDTGSVWRVPYKAGDLKASTRPQKIAELPPGNGHWTRDLQFSKDDKRLFVGVGSASNVDDPDTTPGEKDRADILVMTPEGKDKKVYASGIRNAGGGLTINPKTGELWVSVNERDALGDNLVPDYITHVVEGGFYGWPWWYIGRHQDPRHEGKHPELRDKMIEPDVLLQPHHASLELLFYEGQQFPKEFQGDIFSSQHGSWNKSVRTGYEVIRIPFHGQTRPTGEYQDFLTGFVVDNGHVWGRPVGVTQAPDGSLLVSDDGSNSIWRVSYAKD